MARRDPHPSTHQPTNHTNKQTNKRTKKDAFEIAQHYHAIYDTPAVQAEAAQWQPALQACVIFLIISPHRSVLAGLLALLGGVGFSLAFQWRASRCFIGLRALVGWGQPPSGVHL